RQASVGRLLFASRRCRRVGRWRRDAVTAARPCSVRLDKTLRLPCVPGGLRAVAESLEPPDRPGHRSEMSQSSPLTVFLLALTITEFHQKGLLSLQNDGL